MNPDTNSFGSESYNRNNLRCLLTKDDWEFVYRRWDRTDTIYTCPFCMQRMRGSDKLWRHINHMLSTGGSQHPLGDSDNKIRIFNRILEVEDCFHARDSELVQSLKKELDEK